MFKNSYVTAIFLIIFLFIPVIALTSEKESTVNTVRLEDYGIEISLPSRWI
jgi:hypothetical protein